ncbi:hypothetical protein N9B59_02440, partial [Flavobacteriales bacterium]|nr:hypothetical protein [Flavobacteriales bacterium]
MARDYTKYSIKGKTQGLGKARLVQKVVEDYASTMNMSYEKLKEQWWDDIQGGKGIIRMVSEIDAKNERNYYMKEPVTLSDGTNIVVCNQWGKENFSNFILQAGLLNYEIIADVNDSDSSENDTSAKAETQSSEEVVIEKSESSTAAVSSGWSVMQPDWGMPHALAYLIRHVMVVDGSVEEGELNWMQKAFEEYDKYKIDVRGAWDEVDEAAQLYATIGMNDMVVVNSIKYLNEKLNGDMKSWLINTLMQITAQDDLISKDEYATLMIIAKEFFPG